MKFKEDKTSISYQLRVGLAKAVNRLQGLPCRQAGRTLQADEVCLDHPENEEFGDWASKYRHATKREDPSTAWRVTSRHARSG